MAFFKKTLPELIAAIDLGSNSFHMIVANLIDGEFKIVDRLREMVRLSAGNDDLEHISEDAQQRAIECLERFSQRIQGMPKGTVRVVGTNTLRSADNASEFISRAEATLGHPIEIISGIEEARLIYLGVAHNIAADKNRRLVIDIGGGSTEVIIGEDFAPLCMESLYMGCVSHTLRFFPTGALSSTAMKKAEIAARVELEPISGLFKRVGWTATIGASGTVRSIRKIVNENGWCEHGISRSALKKLVKLIGEASHINELNIKGMAPERAPVLPGGVAILYGIFKELEIDHMDVSDGALREGLLHEVIGRITHEDVRGRSVTNLAKRYHVDLEQSSRIEQTARYCINQVADSLNLDSYDATDWLIWASQLHEIGLNVAHSHYHKHGAYIAQNADLSGFTQREQYLLSILIRTHRRKLPQAVIKELEKPATQFITGLIVLFRLCVLLHRSRSLKPLPEFTLTAQEKSVQLSFPQGWFDEHPLTRADVEQEVDFLKAIDYQMTFE